IRNNDDLLAGGSLKICTILEVCAFLVDKKLFGRWVKPLDPVDSGMAYLVCLSLPVLCFPIRQHLAGYHRRNTGVQ
ncbi:MAG: hypothetical protein PVJ45_08850, partial [Desulfobacterales bacterium]